MIHDPIPLIANVTASPFYIPMEALTPRLNLAATMVCWAVVGAQMRCACTIFAVLLALASPLNGQIVITSVVTEAAYSTLSSDQFTQHYDYLVGSMAPLTAPNGFAANLADYDEIAYHILAGEGLEFSVEVRGSDEVANSYLTLIVEWASGASNSLAPLASSVNLIFHDYEGPGLGYTSLPMTIRTDGSIIKMVGHQYFGEGTHTFSGFSLVTGYAGFDTTGWTERTYEPAPGFRIFHYTLGFLGADAGTRFSLVTAVPEPSTYALIAGVLAVAVTVWSRRKQAA